MSLQSKECLQATKYDSDSEYAKIALYGGERKFLAVFDGSVTLNNKKYLVSFNLPNGSVVRATVIKSRDPSYDDSLFITDIVRFGKNDLSACVYKSRFEILDLVCTSFPDEYGFKMFGARNIAPYVYIATNVGATACLKCQDPRVIGYEVIPMSGMTDAVQVIRGEMDEESVDGIERFPPVPDEGKRVMAYKPLVKSMIRKMSGKWKDVYLSNYQVSQLPFDSEDLMQFGLMQVTIALRKYREDNEWKAKEATFVYQHLWHRFGQIAHKYSKQSCGYGVHHVRDFVDDEGKLVCAYDFGGGDRDD